MASDGVREGFRKLPRPVRWLAYFLGFIVGFALLLGLALAVATNRFLRPLVEEQASAAIPGEVSADSLDIGLFGGYVTVEGLAIRPPEPGAEPVVRVGRLHVSLARLPLLAGRVVVRNVEIDAPFVRLVREESGELDLLRIVVPETPPVEAPEAPPTEPLPIRVDAIALGAGRIEFVDRAQAGAEPLLLDLPAVRIDNLVVTGDPNEDPADLHLEVSAEGARIEVGGKVQREGEKLDVDATVEIENLPLSRGRVYLPDLGWSELSGALDAKIHYVHVTGARQTADGSANLRDLRVGVPNLQDPAFSLDSLAVELEQLDLLARRLALSDVALEGLRVYFDPADPAKLPLLPKGLPGAGEPAPPPPAEPEPPFAWSLAHLGIEKAELIPLGGKLAPLVLAGELESLASDATTPTSLDFELTQGEGSVALTGKLLLEPLGFQGTLTLDALSLPPLLQAAAGEAAALLGAGVAKGEIRIGAGALVAGETPAAGGDVHAEGTLTLSGLEAKSDAEGSLLAKVASVELAFERLDVPGLLPPPAAEGGATPAWEVPADAGTLRFAGKLRITGLGARSGHGEPLAADLKSFELAVKELALARLLAPPPAEGKAPPPDAGSLRFSGTATLAGVAVKSGKDGEFGFDLEKAEVGLRDVSAPSLLAPAPTGGKPHKAEPMQVSLERVRLAAPKLRVTRTPEGIVLPAAPGAQPPKKGEPPKPAETEPAKPAAEGDAVRLELSSLQLENGSVRFVDRAVKPFYQGDVTGLQVSAKGIAFPGPRAQDVSVKMDAPGPAPFWLLGAYTPPKSWFEMNLERLPLPPLNPYVQAASGYVVNRGELSLYSKGSQVDGSLFIANALTLFDPSLSGGGDKSPLEAATGVPVSLAISLLKDPSGNIALSIPVEYGASGASVALGTVIGSAVKQVLIGALTSPLKLVGAVVDAGGRVKDVTPQPIGFLPGREELAESGDERIGALAKLLSTRPGMEIALRGQTSGSDGQFAREAALVAAIESGEGLPEAAQGLGNALRRRRIRGALEARLAGESETLDAEDAQALDDWVGAVVLPPEAMTTLARARATRVRGLLESAHGLDVKRVQLAEPGPPGGSPEPAVDVLLEP